MVLVLSVSYSFSQQKDTVQYVTNTDTEKLIDKYSSKIEASIVALAENLKQPAEHIYGVLVKQQVVKAWTLLIAIIFGFIITVAFWVIWMLDKTDKDEWWGLPVFISIAFFVLLACTLPMVFSGMINPEYGAMKEIAQFFK